MPDRTDRLADAIKALSEPLACGPAALAALLAAARSARYAKGAHLCREGERADALYFVVSGLLRYYYLADGVEHTGQFFDAGMFVADIAALTTGASAVQNIDALIDTEVVVIPRPALLTAYDADHGIERFGRRAVEAAAAGSQRRSANLLKLSAEQRYAHFLQSRPDVARQVPLYIVASYLGVTPEALSRIRRRRI